jgi:hypothetical protein
MGTRPQSIKQRPLTMCLGLMAVLPFGGVVAGVCQREAALEMQGRGSEAAVAVAAPRMALMPLAVLERMESS